MSRADRGRNDEVLRRVQSQWSSLGLENLHVPNKGRNERLARALSFRGVPQSGQSEHVSVKKGVDLLPQQVTLGGAEQLFGLRQGQPEMLEALVILVEGDDIGDGFFVTLIVTNDELQFDTHTVASPGSSGR